MSKFLKIGFVILMLLSAMISILTGVFETSLSDVWNAIFNYDTENLTHTAIVKLRLPRLLLAFLAGGMLALSGYLMQLLINNPLADPFILGTSSAASVGANVVYFLPLSLQLGIFLPMFSAFIFALLVTSFVIIIATVEGRVFPSRLLLAGIALSSLMTSVVALMSYFSSTENVLKSIVFWVMGSLDASNWISIGIISVLALLSLIIFYIITPESQMLILGFEKAKQLGLNEKKIRWTMLIGSTMMASVVVSVCGPIGFVGLMIPHVNRAIFGVIDKNAVFHNFLLGGTFVIAADVLSRLIYFPTGIPIGIITSLFGVPFFIYLLLKKGYNFQ